MQPKKTECSGHNIRVTAFKTRFWSPCSHAIHSREMQTTVNDIPEHKQTAKDKKKKRQNEYRFHKDRAFR